MVTRARNNRTARTDGRQQSVCLIVSYLVTDQYRYRYWYLLASRVVIVVAAYLGCYPACICVFSERIFLIMMPAGII